jgi:hypothetical protein
MKEFTVINDKLEEFKIKVIQKGDKYGLNDCLTHTENDNLIGVHLLENDYLISRYYQSTIMQSKHGINLDSVSMLDLLTVQYIQQILRKL